VLCPHAELHATGEWDGADRHDVPVRQPDARRATTSLPRETPTARRFVESDGAEDLLRNPQSAYTKSY
jgi:hypothetical protein